MQTREILTRLQNGEISVDEAEQYFRGQPFEEAVYEKVRRVRKLMEIREIQVPISVDGGVNEERGRRLIEAGADILVAGTAIFQEGSVAEAVKNLKQL